jgi:hypothetical protein
MPVGGSGVTLSNGVYVSPCFIHNGLHICRNDTYGDGGRMYESKDGFEVYVQDSGMYDKNPLRR